MMRLCYVLMIEFCSDDHWGLVVKSKYLVLLNCKYGTVLKPLKKTATGPDRISYWIWKEHEISDSKAIANAFNDFFTNIGHNLAQSIPDTAKPVMLFMPMQQSNNFFLNAAR